MALSMALVDVTKSCIDSIKQVSSIFLLLNNRNKLAGSAMWFPIDKLCQNLTGCV